MNRGRRSCGCLRNGNRVTSQEAGLNYVLKNYKVSARGVSKRKSFTLQDEDAKRLFASACAYCGSPPVLASWKGRREFFYNGIDRVDSSLGYVPGNCVPCCTTCNRAKNSLALEEFQAWAQRFAAFQTATPVPVSEALPNPDVVLFWLNDAH